MTVIDHILQDYPWLAENMAVVELLDCDGKIFSNNPSQLKKWLNLQDELTEIDGLRKILFTGTNFLGKPYLCHYFETKELSDDEKNLINNTIHLIAQSIKVIEEKAKTVRNSEESDTNKHNALKIIFKENTRLQYLLLNNCWDIGQEEDHISGFWWKISGTAPIRQPFLYKLWCRFRFWLNA